MTPPRLGLWLIERRFPADEAEAIIGDLSEEFADRAAASRLRAALWFWAQALASLVAPRAARQRRGPGPMTGLAADVRLGLRHLAKAPGFAITSVATLAIGVGAATAVGTAASRVLLRPLPFPSGERLVALGDGAGSAVGNVGFVTALDWQRRLTTLDEIAIIRSWQPTLSDPAGAVRLNGMRVSWNFFRALGVRPALGRDFESADDTPDTSRQVIISDALWRSRFHASPSVLGQSLDFFGRTYTIVGVLPASYEPLISERFFERADVWAPLGYAIDGNSSCRTCRHLKAIGRLAPGATVESARAELQSVQSDLRRQFPKDYAETPPRLEPLRAVIADNMTTPLRMLMGAVAFVLLVACANVAGLLVARASARTSEMALRAALGASRSRLVRQLVIEALVLGGIAAVAGVLIARAGLIALAADAPVRIPRLDGAAADPWLFALAGAIALVAVLIAAVVPAFISTGVSLEATLRESKQTSSRGALRARRWMMAAEIAAALLVTAGAGLMYRTVDRLLAVDPGFRSQGVMTAGLSLIGQRWAEDDPVRAFQRDLLERIRAVPGVEVAALAGQVPLGGNYDRWTAHLPDRPSASEAEEPSAERYSVTPDYFELMGIPLKAGRLLNDVDRFGVEIAIVINETFARQAWPGESPIGKRVRFGSAARPRPAVVVGVVGDVRHYALSEPANPQFYATQEQFTDSFLILLVRATEPAAIGPAIRREVAALATDVAVYDVQPFDALVSTSIATRSFLMLLLAGLGGVTLVLAGVGLYGVVSQSVGARQRELGIRVALGASRASVTSLVAREGLGVFATGAALGLAGAAFAGQLIKSQLFEVRPFDPLTLLGALGALSAVAVLAHVGPIRRALRADPRETLKSD